MMLSNQDRQNNTVARGIAFGVFDSFHPGHEYFLKEALKQCDQLVVVVTLDDAVLHFKNRLPKYTLAERMEKVKGFGESLSKSLNKKIIVVPGDSVSQMGEWPVLEKHNPNVVFVGYDQKGIVAEMARLGIPTIFIPAHFPEKYKSSIINND